MRGGFGIVSTSSALNSAASVLLLLLVSGCAHAPPGPASVAGGDCKIAHASEYEMLGKTPRDQIWIDETNGSLIAGCGHPPPKPRPPEWDADQAPPPKAMPPKKKKRKLLSSLKRFVAPRAMAAPVPLFAEPVTAPSASPPPFVSAPEDQSATEPPPVTIVRTRPIIPPKPPAPAAPPLDELLGDPN